MTLLRTLGVAVGLMAVGLWLGTLVTLPAWLVMGVAVVGGLLFFDWHETGEVMNLLHHLVAGGVTGLLLLLAVNLPLLLWVVSLVAVFVALWVADKVAPMLPGYSEPRRLASAA